MPDGLLSILNSPITALALRLGVIALLTLLAQWSLSLFIRQFERQMEKTVRGPERLARLKTLAQVGRGAASVIIFGLAALMSLHIIGIDIAPLLAGAGLAGLALSLGAQTLIKDFIGGILILTENQFTIGEVIKVGEVSGSVERITLRATYVRDGEGRLHLIPNGDLRTISNLTAEWARAIVDLNIQYEADIDSVMHVLEEAAAQAQADQALQAKLLEPPQALGWIGLTDWAVQVRLTAKTKPGKQWEVTRTLRQYAMEALHKAGVKLSRPTQVFQLDQTGHVSVSNPTPNPDETEQAPDNQKINSKVGHPA